MIRKQTPMIVEILSFNVIMEENNLPYFRQNFRQRAVAFLPSKPSLAQQIFCWPWQHSASSSTAYWLPTWSQLLPPGSTRLWILSRGALLCEYHSCIFSLLYINFYLWEIKIVSASHSFWSFWKESSEFSTFVCFILKGSSLRSALHPFWSVWKEAPDYFAFVLITLEKACKYFAFILIRLGGSLWVLCIHIDHFARKHASAFHSFWSLWKKLASALLSFWSLWCVS